RATASTRSTATSCSAPAANTRRHAISACACNGSATATSVAVESARRTRTSSPSTASTTSANGSRRPVELRPYLLARVPRQALAMRALGEFLDNLAAEGGDVLGVAARHQAAIHDDFLVDPF